MSLLDVKWEGLHEELGKFTDFFSHFDTHDIVAELDLGDRVGSGE